MDNKQKSKWRKNYNGKNMIIGMVIGIIIGFILDIMNIGNYTISLWMCLGIAIGTGLDYKKTFKMKRRKN